MHLVTQKGEEVRNLTRRVRSAFFTRQKYGQENLERSQSTAIEFPDHSTEETNQNNKVGKYGIERRSV
jgi:hypothetical protein